MPGLRARVQRDEHSGAWRPDSIGKEGKSPAVKERSLQTPQGGRMPHDSLPYPKVRSRGPADLGRLGRLSSALQVPLPTWTQLLGLSNATTPKLPGGAAHLDVGSSPRSRSPAPQYFMVTPHACSLTLPGPPRAARLLSPLPRGGAIQLRPAPGRPGAHPAAARSGRREERAGDSAAAAGRAREEATPHRAVLFPKYARSGHPANS